MVSLYGMVEAVVLFLNALAILHERRFLNKSALSVIALTFIVGLATVSAASPSDPFAYAGSGPVDGGVKQRIATLLHAIRLVLRGSKFFLKLICSAIDLDEFSSNRVFDSLWLRDLLWINVRQFLTEANLRLYFPLDNIKLSVNRELRLYSLENVQY